MNFWNIILGFIYHLKWDYYYNIPVYNIILKYNSFNQTKNWEIMKLKIY